ncbi:hypothetical protein ACQH7J_08935 [Streptococcus pyogenes]|nr:hypothetical protein [Anaerococcus vaginalis]MDU6182730.1 hypothetical protein [Anaerococcus vaginalis]
MATNKRYYWIKLKEEFFIDKINEDIVLNESNPCPTRDRYRVR